MRVRELARVHIKFSCEGVLSRFHVNVNKLVLFNLSGTKTKQRVIDKRMTEDVGVGNRNQLFAHGSCKKCFFI